MRPGYEKRFCQGDIVYWCGRDRFGKPQVKWGMVDEQFSDAVCIDFLDRKENRYIDGIPIYEYYLNQSTYKYKKLPKGWTWNTKLYEVETREIPEEEELLKNARIDDPVAIKKLYDAGLLVKCETKFRGTIHTNIEKGKGYKVVLEYPLWEKFQEERTSVRPDKVYSTYKEAQDEVDAINAEFLRQSQLSDYDWAVEEIDKTLDHWMIATGSTPEERNKYREWILAMDHVEDIETRVSMGYIQWKYYDKKKWNDIEL